MSVQSTQSTLPVSSSTIKNTTSGSINLLQKFYRSREFNKNIFTAINLKNEYTFAIYGSINTLSSKQRNLFRAYVNKFSDFANITVKLTLFSSTVAKSLISFSSLSQLDTQFKGTTYQRILTITKEREHEATKERIDFINHLSKLKYTEDTNFNFEPSIVLVLSAKGKLIASHRFIEYVSIVSKEIYAKGNSMSYLVSTIDQIRKVTI
jgi:hypothetical protein